MRLILVCAYFCVSIMDASAQTITSEPSAVDGDSLAIAVRLQGIDAPEFNQQCKDAEGVCYNCGRVSAAHLQAFVRMSGFHTKLNRGMIACSQHETDKYGRAIATCLYGEDTTLGEMMLKIGQAVAAPQYISDQHIRDRYLAAEAQAKAEQRGMWNGQFDHPRDWRSETHRICPPFADGR